MSRARLSFNYRKFPMKSFVAVLVALIISTPLAARSQSKNSSGTVQHHSITQWDHKKHIRLCETADSKQCTVLSIPPGITEILGIVHTKSTPDVTHTFVIIGRKNSYLCASGIGGLLKLRCQRLPSDIPLNELTPERAQAQLENTLTLLRANSATTARVVMGDGDGADCDIETGVCRGDAGSGGDYDNGGGSTAPSGGYADIGAADTVVSYQAMADDFIANDFEGGMNEFLATARTQPPMKCSVVASQCRETCSSLQNLENTGCTALGVAAGIALTPSVGGGCRSILWRPSLDSD